MLGFKLWVWMWCGNEKCAEGESEEWRGVTLRLINEDNVAVPAIIFRICKWHYYFSICVLGLGF